MQNLRDDHAPDKRMAPGLDVKASPRVRADRRRLDYELEAQNQRSLARIFAGTVHRRPRGDQLALPRARAISDSYQVGFGEQGSRPARTRPHPEIVFRFFLGCLYRHRQFSGDPIRATLLLGDGRISVSGLQPVQAHGTEAGRALSCQRAVVEATPRAPRAAGGVGLSPRTRAGRRPAGVRDGRDLVVRPPTKWWSWRRDRRRC